MRDRDLEAPWIGRDYDRYRNQYYGLVEVDMSDLWGYSPEKCDGGFCCYDCDCCSKAEQEEDEEE